MTSEERKRKHPPIKRQRLGYDLLVEQLQDQAPCGTGLSTYRALVKGPGFLPGEEDMPERRTQ
jgi:hypothetical protein